MLVVVQNVQVSNVEPDERERREKLPVEVVEEEMVVLEELLDGKGGIGGHDEN